MTLREPLSRPLPLPPRPRPPPRPPPMPEKAFWKVPEKGTAVREPFLESPTLKRTKTQRQPLIQAEKL